MIFLFLIIVHPVIILIIVQTFSLEAFHNPCAKCIPGQQGIVIQYDYSVFLPFNLIVQNETRGEFSIICSVTGRLQ
jgi:hypothetical protein